jgi:hypothetical protein
MLPFDVTMTRMRFSMDRLTACLRETFLLSSMMRSALLEGRMRELSRLIGEYVRLAEETCVAGEEMTMAVIDIRGRMGECPEKPLPDVLRHIDKSHGTDFLDRLDSIMETASKLVALQAANGSLVCSMAQENARHLNFLMNFLGGWVIYDDDGSADIGKRLPRRLSFSA